MCIRDSLSSIRKAKNEDKVKGIYLETGILETDYATLQEIRNALADFKKSGKWIIAYGDALSQGGYYLASVSYTHLDVYKRQPLQHKSSNRHANG